MIELELQANGLSSAFHEHSKVTLTHTNTIPSFFNEIIYDGLLCVENKISSKHTQCGNGCVRVWSDVKNIIHREKESDEVITGR